MSLMKNNLKDLNNYLFEELERLNSDDELVGDNLDREIKRAKAISSIGMSIVNNARVVLDAKKYADEHNVGVNEVLMIGGK